MNEFSAEQSYDALLKESFELLRDVVAGKGIIASEILAMQLRCNVAQDFIRNDATIRYVRDKESEFPKTLPESNR